MTRQENLDMALDLLVARASLDADLRQELLTNPEAHCIENGIQLPEGTQLIFTSADSSLIIKEIPVITDDYKSIEHTETAPRELVSNVFNTGESTTETNTNTVAEAEATAVEVQTAITTITGIVEIVAVGAVVLTWYFFENKGEAENTSPLLEMLK